MLNLTEEKTQLVVMQATPFCNINCSNVFDGTLEGLPKGQKFRDIDTLIQEGVSKCKQTCQYFAYCGGGAPANKWYENKRFDLTETMYCRLGKQALLDVVLEYNS